MTISLEAISFNHDPTSSSRDAFTIRKNQNEDVAVPEWNRGMTLPGDSRAAYSVNQILANGLTIKAQFRRQPADPTTVEIHATGRSGNVLGNVKPRTIAFAGELSAFELFELDSPPGNPGVGLWDISWDWFVAGGLVQTTAHRVYTILDAPKAPWGQAGSSFSGFQVPWTEVLEHACLAASGAMNVDEAAAKLTRWVYSLGDSKLKYNDYGSGSSCFTIQGMNAFKCTSFLAALSNGRGSKETVNCVDCATILSSFANILGCELSQSQIGFEFQTNLIQKIGSDYHTAQPFRFHEVAWKFPAGGSPTVFDCCVQIDGDTNMTDDNFSPILGINFPMGSPTGFYYHGRLIKPTRRGRACREWPGTRKLRKIENGGGVLTRVRVEETQLQLLAEEYEFPSWRGSEVSEPPKEKCESHYANVVAAAEKPSTSEQSLFLKNFGFSKDQGSPSGWKPRDVKSYRAEPDPVRVTEAVWSSGDCSGATLRVITYECSSLASARSFLLALLAEFQVPGIKRRTAFILGDKQVTIGDVAFAGQDEVVLLFARANNVIFIQNVGHTPVSVSQFAHELDQDMASNPEPEKGQEIKMEQFEISSKQACVGDEILIQTGTECEKETRFKFFAPGGQVFLKGDDLMYRPRNAGEQSIIILACKAGQEPARQVLTVFVEPSTRIQETTCPEVEKPIKEERVMPDITGVWSSIRPTNNGVDSADMTVDGYIEIRERDPNTDEIRGFYRDEEPRSKTELVTGRVIFLDSRFYITLSHPLSDGVTRFYEGQLVATDGDVQIVAGNYYDRLVSNGNGNGNNSGAAIASDSFAALDGGQENGTWVATKP
jgi:hypothetical protein